MENSNGVDEKVNAGFRSIVGFPLRSSRPSLSLVNSPSRLLGFPSFDQRVSTSRDNVRSVHGMTYTEDTLVVTLAKYVSGGGQKKIDKKRNRNEKKKKKRSYGQTGRISSRFQPLIRRRL